jgi:RNA-directed DNA polymerase
MDKDYAMLIARIRRYLYGDLSERELRRYAAHGSPLRRFKGVMAAFPMVDDDDALRQLDAWILTTVWLGLRKRGRLLTQQGYRHLPPPHNLSRAQLRALRLTSPGTGETVDLRVPSVRRIAKVVDLASARLF